MRKDLTPKELKGRRPRIRVIEELGHVQVYWWDGRRRYKSYPGTPAGRLEAKAYAKGLSERKAPNDGPTRLTTAGLWSAYIAAEERRLRPRSVQLYGQHWRKWEVFIGAESIAEDVPTAKVAEFRGAMAKRHKATQVRIMIRVVKAVYNWADELELIGKNRVTRYRFKLGKDEEVVSASEYRTPQWEAILTAMGGGQDARNWRAYVAVLLAGAQGERINAVLRLKWKDIDFERGVITWPKATNKVGRSRVQPLTDEGISALLTAKYWNQRLRHLSGLVLVIAPAYQYRAFYGVLRAAEIRANIPHSPWRAAHGFRKMSAGNVRDRFKDAALGMEWIGDKDPRMMEEYIKERPERMEQVTETQHP